MRSCVRQRFGILVSGLICFLLLGRAAAAPPSAQFVRALQDCNDKPLAEALSACLELADLIPREAPPGALPAEALEGLQHRLIVAAAAAEQRAQALQAQGNLDASEEMLRRAAAGFTRALGKEHPRVMQTLGTLTHLLLKRRKFDEAEPLVRRALAMAPPMAKRSPQTNGEFALLHLVLADVLRERGNLAEAEAQVRSALALQEASLGKDHPDIALTLTSAANLLLQSGQLDQAEPLLRRALAMETRALGKDHPRVASVLHPLAVLLIKRGRHAEAEPLLRRALAIQEAAPEQLAGDVTAGRLNLAALLMNLGRYAEAEQQLRRALTLAESSLGSEHTQVARAHGHLAVLSSRQGLRDEALVHYRQQLSILEHRLRSSPTEEYAGGLLDELLRSSERVNGLTLQPPQSQAAITLAMQATLLLKSRSLDVGRLASQALKRALRSPEQQPRYAQMQAALSERARMLDQGSGTPAEIKKLLFAAQQIEQELAREVGVKSSQALPEMAQIIDPVAARLPSDSVLIEIVRGPHERQRAALEPRPQFESHYIALLLFPDKQMAAFDLGPLETVHRQVASFSSALESIGPAVKTQARAVYEQILQPLDPMLKARGVRRLIVSPDGPLQLIPWGALHDGTQYQIDRFTIQYVSAGRDLLQERSAIAPGPALVLADPTAPGQRRLDSARRVSIALARELAVEPILDAQATEQSLLVREAPYVMLLAAHGRYRDGLPLPPSLQPLQPARSDARLFAAPEPLDTPTNALRSAPEPWNFEVAMHRSALALTPGRDAASDSWQDGWLTGEEARALRLRGTQLVTLLACESGRGAASSGQGIFGLRRALLQAGAETVVSTLWSVEERSASELVRRYVSKLLQQKRDRVEALTEAMQELRGQPAYQHPYYWAPFIVMGLNGPLRPPQGAVRE